MNASLPPIRFTELAAALLLDAKRLVPMWLPDGDLRGHEYVCGSLAGGKGGSCSVNMTTGQWADFATGEQGGDLLSLYATVNGLTMGKAALQVARENGLESVAGIVTPAPAGSPPPPPPRPAPPPKPQAEAETWRTVLPVPPYAVAPTFRHFHRSAIDIEHTATYRVGDDVHGYVVRFRTSDGGKDTLPYTWCESARDGAAKWHWRQFDAPRPLFLPGQQLPGSRTVVLVEGEPKAECLQQLLDGGAPGVYCVVSWPGGSKAWQKADWVWLYGCTVLAWADCDAKREPLTPAERKATPDKAAQAVLQQAKPLLPVHKQPGMAAMLGIGARLRDAHACNVQLLPIPAPGAVADGWDCRDAIETDGWDFARVLAFFGQAQALPADGAEPAPVAKKITPVGTGDVGRAARGVAPSQGDFDDDAARPGWLMEFWDFKKQRWDLRRSLVVAALQNSPQLQGCVAFNELTKSVQVRKPWPWQHSRAGDLEADSTLLLGRYLTDRHGVGDISTQNLKDGIHTVAYTERFHPVREWLDGVRWDGVPRLDKWLVYVLGESPDSLPPQLLEYLSLVGRYWLMGLVWRVMEPGCKFDYCPVLEGKGGLRKSTLVEVLAVRKEWHSDTKFELSRGKEAYEQVRGKWVYEIGELSSFSKADVNDIKAFISSKEDNYRVAYGEQSQSFPRQCVLVGSTNDDRYLRDRTGNRRFWPIPVRHVIKTEWVERMREQLFAEAYALYQRGGEPYTPTEDLEKRLFVPMQESRLMDSAIDGELLRLLTRPSAASLDDLVHCDAKRVPLNSLVKALNVDIGKSTQALTQQIQACMASFGWVNKGRQRIGKEMYSSVYFPPPVWPPSEVDSETDWTRLDLGAVPSAALPPTPEVATGDDSLDDYAPF